jgi:Bifunctional DNA primase/polymerase, N-terminal
MTMHTQIGAEALRLHTALVNTLPILLDGSKSPSVKWAARQEQLATRTQIKADHAEPRALAMVCGAGSGNVEDLDFDAPELLEPWIGIVTEHLPLLVGKLVIWKTPRGYGVAYRCATRPAGNTELAWGYRDKDDGKGLRKVALIQTRGQGGYCLIPPSADRAHPTGRPYVYIQGDLARLPILTHEEHKVLWDAARSLNELPAQEKSAPRTAPARPTGARPRLASQKPTGGVRPGGDFNQRGDWAELLDAAGWTKVFTRGDVEYWRRPGKDIGHSATLNYGGRNRLYVFTTSDEHLEAGTSYDLFAAYAAIHHKGNYTAAARALWHQGYGRLAATRWSRRPPDAEPQHVLGADDPVLWDGTTAEDDRRYFLGDDA